MIIDIQPNYPSLGSAKEARDPNNVPLAARDANEAACKFLDRVLLLLSLREVGSSTNFTRAASPQTKRISPNGFASPREAEGSVCDVAPHGNGSQTALHRSDAALDLSALSTLLGENEGLASTQDEGGTIALTRSLYSLYASSATDAQCSESVMRVLKTLEREIAVLSSSHVDRVLAWRLRSLYVNLSYCAGVSTARSITTNEIPILCQAHRGDTSGNVYHVGNQSFKILRPHGDKTPQNLHHDVFRQAAIRQLMAHANVLPIDGVVYINEKPIGVASPWKRWTQRDWVMNIRFTTDSVVTQKVLLPMLHQGAKGLAYIHSTGFVHGNLKSTNILVDDEGQVSIAGLCSMTHCSDVSTLGRYLHDTIELQARVPVEEQASDVWAFGSIALEAFTEVPNRAPIQKGMAPIMPIAVGDSPMTNDLWHLIEACCDILPSRRPTASKVVETLEELISSDR